MNNLSFFHIIVISIFLVTIIAAQDAFTLEYTFTKGKTYRYRTINNATMANEMKGYSTTTNSTTTNSAKIMVEDVTPNHSFVIVASVDSFLSIVDGKGTSAAAGAIVGKRTRLTVSRHGTIEQREIIDSIRMNGIDMNKMQFINLLLVLPEKKLSIASTWAETKIDTMIFFGISMINTITTQYTVKETEKKNEHACIKISYKSNSTMNGSGKPQGMSATAKGETTSEGIYYFDVQKGLLVADESTTNGIISMSMENGMSFSIKTDGKTTKTLVE